jgi:hypothetical protein
MNLVHHYNIFCFCINGLLSRYYAIILAIPIFNSDAPLSELKHILVLQCELQTKNYVKILSFPLKAEYDCKHVLFNKVTDVVFLHNQSGIS